MLTGWRSWKTSDVEANVHDYWHDVIQRGVVAAQLEGTNRHFTSAMASRTVGGARFVNLEVSGEHRISRDRAQSGRADDRYYMIGLQVSGALHVEQGGDRVIASCGDLIGLHSGHSFDLKFVEPVDRRLVLVPRVVLDRFLPQGSALAAGRPVVFATNRVALRIVSDIIRHLTDTQQAWDEHDCATSVECLARLLGGALRDPPSHLSKSGGRTRTSGRDVAALIGMRATEFDLNPGTVARELNISVRSLHRLLAQTGSTFSQCLLDARLDCAYALLNNGDAVHRSLTSIAMETGFCDAAHFSRTFARKFGCPPSKARLSS